MTLKIYQVHGTRQPVIIFAFTPEEAVAQALERGLVNPWEKPEASEIPLPKGYRLIYDPLVGAMEQAALPLSLEEPLPEPAHTITRSGVKVYDDWQANIIVDADVPPIAWKAGRDLFGANTGVPGDLDWPARIARMPSPGTCSASWKRPGGWRW